MSNKVVLISIDGMRPDGLKNCNNEYVDELIKTSSYTFNAKTVFPSVTLPCHMSMFLSAPPERHGITTNIYTPQVRPITGLFELLNSFGKRSCMFYGWETLRDISRPQSLVASEYIEPSLVEKSDNVLTDDALSCIKRFKPDFVFLYLVETDDFGHSIGWMSKPYIQCINRAIDNVKKVITETNGEYTVIVTADHGGHERRHGENIPEDMTIPMFFNGHMFDPGKCLENISILDIAPTIAKVMDVPIPPEWEGTPII